MILAGIDIGTLTCRLLIADVTAGPALSEVDSDRRILRLGEGVDQRKCLSRAAMARVVEALCEWRARIQRYAVEEVVVVATSAVREAKNREEFLEWVKRDIGFDVEVLSGEEEAQRTLLGIESGLPATVNCFLGLDIGGGSTELMRNRKIWINQGPRVYSLELGVVRLTERILQGDPPTEAAFSVAERLIRIELQRIRTALGNLTGVTMVGTAGTVTTLAAMVQKLSHYDPRRIHNFWLHLDEIRELETELRLRTQSERRQMPGLEQGREGVIMAGTLILRVVMQTLGFQRCLVSDYGLREGILVHQAARLKN